MDTPYFSIVITVFNRAWCVRRAVASAVRFSGELPVEIILVDDASTDASVATIEALLREDEACPNISYRFIRHPVNKGVCGAKNSGASAAAGQWIIFLDSDDELIDGMGAQVRRGLEAHAHYPLHFYRCIGELDQVAECADSVQLRPFQAYFAQGTDGESLPVVARGAVAGPFYDEDINGYESLAYLRMVKAAGAAVLHSLPVRRYYTSHDSRLSSKAGMSRRYRSLARGHRRVLGEHWRDLGVLQLVRQCARYCKAVALAFSSAR